MSDKSDKDQVPAPESTVELAAAPVEVTQAVRSEPPQADQNSAATAAPRRSLAGWLLGGHGATAWLWLSALVVVLDQITKAYVVANFEYARPLFINGWLDFTRLHNYGAAFSILADAGGWQHWLFIGLALVVGVVLFVWLWRLPRRGQAWLACSLALVLGGALGNVIDRVRFGYVVDFIHAHWDDLYWPAFNVADMAISVGAVMLVLESFWTRESRAPERPDPDA